jgi:lysyl-tRNA synthetase, class II
VLSDGRARLQVYVRKDALSERDYQLSRLLDFGDCIGVSGHLFRTKTNELSIWASSLTFLVKCLVPLPEKWHGLQDVETLPPALSRPDRQPGCAARVRGAQPHRRPPCATS